LAADYAISLCFTDQFGVYVNLYAPAQLTWQQGGITCRLRIATDYPYDGIVSFTLTLPSSLRFALRLRIPAWVTAAQVHINGRRDSALCLPGTFVAIDREWRPGDRVDLEMSLPVRLLSIDAQHPHTVALLGGPLVLMCMLDGQAEAAAAITARELVSARRTSAGTHDWHVITPRATLNFRPFMDIDEEPYRVYQDVAATGG
jgi:DUF1680 family protein